jgi:hypothetical protein
MGARKLILHMLAVHICAYAQVLLSIPELMYRLADIHKHKCNVRVGLGVQTLATEELLGTSPPWPLPTPSGRQDPGAGPSPRQ